MEGRRLAAGATFLESPRMRLIYLSGPYRAPTINGIYENIQRARAAALHVLKSGDFPIVPHLNTAFMDGIIEDESFLQGDLEVLSRLDHRKDLVVMLDGWKASEGSRRERDRALELGLLVVVWSQYVEITGIIA